MGTVREYSMMFLVVEIKAREVTCPEERLLIYQQIYWGWTRQEEDQGGDLWW